MMQASDIVANLYSLFSAQDYRTLLDSFAAEPNINIPMEGLVSGVAGFRDLVDRQGQWLESRQATSELLAVTGTPHRVVAELVLYLNVGDGQTDLPVAVAAELDGRAISSLRVYHSTWPLTGKHLIRAPILEAVDGLEEPEVIREYMAGLGRADAEAILALFNDDGYAREPSGARYKHEGPAGLREFYTAILKQGPIVLKHCTAAFDGQRIAVEYICDFWGRTPLPPQCGIAVYDIDTSGKMEAARIYDDISPPGG